MGTDSKKELARYFMNINGEWKPVNFADVTDLIDGAEPEKEPFEPCSIKRVIFSGPATIVFWSECNKLTDVSNS